MALEKSNRQFSVVINHSVGELTISPSKLDPAAFPPIVFHRGRASEATRMRAEMLGWKNRIVDLAAKGQMVSAEEKYRAMERGVAHLESGTEDWGLAATRTQSSDDAMLVGALMELSRKSGKSKSREEIAALVKTWDSAKRYAVRNREDVKEILDRMMSEQAADVDTDEMLDEII